jgi:hypothetical protein
MKKIPEKILTDRTPQVEVVTLAVYQLGGAQKAVDTEDVAMEADRLAPGRFSWKKYPGQINLELIRVFLSDAKKTQNGLVIGSQRTGWRLTQEGLNWAETAAKTLGKSNLSRTRAQLRSGGPEEQHRRRERDRLLKSAAWRIWKSGGRDIPISEAKQVFRLDSYARGDLREAKITRLLDMFCDDAALTPFLKHLIQHLNREATL